MNRAVRSRATYVSENVITLGILPSWTGSATRGVIFAHGSGGTAEQTLTEGNHRRLVHGLAQTATVETSDWGLQSWGNDLAVSRIAAGVARLRSDWGVVGPVDLVGVSMGGCNVLNYAVRNPTEVASVALVLGLTDLGRVYDDNTASVATEIDAAYGGDFDATDREGHSPIAFVDDLPADLPIALWTAPDDTIVLPETHAAFIATRPQTTQTMLPSGGGHSAASVGAAADSVIGWVRSTRLEE